MRPRKDQSMPSKSEISHIRQAAAAARLRLKVVHCDAIKTQVYTGQPIQEGKASGSIVPARIDPVIGIPPTDKMDMAPATPPAVRSLFSESPTSSSNKFAVLSSTAQSSIHEDPENIYEE